MLILLCYIFHYFNVFYRKSVLNVNQLSVRYTEFVVEICAASLSGLPSIVALLLCHGPQVIKEYIHQSL